MGSHHIHIKSSVGDKADTLKTKQLSMQGNQKHGLHITKPKPYLQCFIKIDDAHNQKCSIPI